MRSRMSAGMSARAGTGKRLTASSLADDEGVLPERVRLVGDNLPPLMSRSRVTCEA